MLHTDKFEMVRLQERLRAVEREFERGMRARGFDPAQDQNLALTSPLAKLYEEREQLRASLEAWADSDKPSVSED